MDPTNHIYLDGIGLAGYRSFGSKMQFIGPLSKINLLIGPNNCGKSNVLRFLTRHFQHILKTMRGGKGDLVLDEDLDGYKGPKSAEHRLAIAMRRDHIRRHLTICQIANANVQTACERLLRDHSFTKGTEASWFIYEMQKGVGALRSPSIDEMINCMDRPKWKELYQSLHPRHTGGSIQGTWIPDVLKVLSPKVDSTKSIKYVPAFREISDVDKGGDRNSNLAGYGLIGAIFARLNPQRRDKARADEELASINRFLCEVSGRSYAKLRVPHPPKEIIVDMDDRELPLDSLGTGIHEAVILAAAATFNKECLMCIEEPEIHLHPGLQKKLIRYIAEKTSNQYIIATHSAHFLDYENATVFECSYSDDQTKVRLASTQGALFAICGNLGYRASDLFQANCIIWVEGPSDRIYLRAWIESLADDLELGVHYSIMFYGGKLLSHLSAAEVEAEGQDDVGDFISLGRLNRNVVVVMDSDRREKSSAINKTKARVRDELSKDSGMVWITKGREIENYIDRGKVVSALKEIYSNFQEVEDEQVFGKVYGQKSGKEIDKVRLARKLVESGVDLKMLDLEERVTELVGYIHRTNGIEPEHNAKTEAEIENSSQ